MKVAVMQPYLFPYFGYFQLIAAVDTFVILDDVAYINKGWINRNNILLNNKPYRFTLNLQSASQNKRINQIIIGDNCGKILETFRHAYSKAPYFPDIYRLCRECLEYDNLQLAEFIGHSLHVICRYLDISTTLMFSSSLAIPHEIAGSSKIISICLRLGASDYINAPGGKSLYDKNVFANHNLNLSFIRPMLPEYDQKADAFIPNLSVIDTLMHCSPTTCRAMLDDYTLE